MLSLVLSLIWGIVLAWGRSFARVVSVMAALIFATSALAGIVKTGVPNGNKIQLHAWSNLEIPTAWHFDERASQNFGMDALARDSTTFRNAETEIYARAVYKSQMPQNGTVIKISHRERME